MEHECIHGIEQDWCAICKRPLAQPLQDRVGIAIYADDRYTGYRILNTGTVLPNGMTVFDIVSAEGAPPQTEIDRATVSHYVSDGPLMLVAKAMCVLHSLGSWDKSMTLVVENHG